MDEPTPSSQGTWSLSKSLHLFLDRDFWMSLTCLSVKSEEKSRDITLMVIWMQIRELNSRLCSGSLGLILQSKITVSCSRLLPFKNSRKKFGGSRWKGEGQCDVHLQAKTELRCLAWGPSALAAFLERSRRDFWITIQSRKKRHYTAIISYQKMLFT